MRTPRDDKPKILIVEDGLDIALLVETRLSQEGYCVHVETDGLQGLSVARHEDLDLLILDRTLPGLDGLEICRRIRQSSDVPILMLTAHGDPVDRVEGLNSGANDYLAKPFHLDELVARVKVQLRIRRPQPKSVLRVGDLSVDLDTHDVRRADVCISLTRREFDLLRCLMRASPRVVPREQLLESVWGFDFDGGDNVLDVFIRSLRQKLERSDWPKLIHTVRGIGFSIRDDVSAP